MSDTVLLEKRRAARIAQHAAAQRCNSTRPRLVGKTGDLDKSDLPGRCLPGGNVLPPHRIHCTTERRLTDAPPLAKGLLTGIPRRRHIVCTPPNREKHWPNGFRGLGL